MGSSISRSDDGKGVCESTVSAAVSSLTTVGTVSAVEGKLSQEKQELERSFCRALEKLIEAYDPLQFREVWARLVSSYLVESSGDSLLPANDMNNSADRHCFSTTNKIVLSSTYCRS
jgi:hypothetical protein